MRSNCGTRLVGIAFALIAAALPLLGQAAPPRNPDRNAYFGETHVHTSWSLDAFAIGNLLTTPGDAYKYFKGEPIKHPLGYDVKIDTPLDWAGVTDHSEYAGVVKLANEPGSAVSKIPAGAAADPEGQDEGGDGAGRAVRHQHARPRTAGQGAHVPGDRRHGLEAERRARRPGERAGQVHGVLLVRVDLDAEQHEPAPQRLLQGLRARCRRRRSARSTRTIRWTSGTGWTASARPATSCSPSRTTPTSRTAACSRPRSTPRAARSTPPTPRRACATSR